MESAELERNIGELEEKLDRLRALYEQYFCGIEKLEPQVPRKDVDRRIVLIRKEQIRNTAMRFKFNTVVQRYNTMQQHWNRVLREIENGTFKRDLVRAAARFGVDDALTAVGRKRAKSMAAGLQAQVDRQAKKQRKTAEEREDDYEEVADADVQVDVDDFDDDAPTPPPVPGASQPEHAGHPAAPFQPSAPFQAGYADAGYQQTAYAQHEYAQQQQQYAQQQQQYAQQQYAQQQYALQQQQYAQQQQQYAQQYAQQQAQQQHVAQPWAPRASDPEIEARPATWPPQSSGPASVVPKKAGGLRLGGGPSKRASAEALNRIASSLGDAAPNAAAPARKPLLSSPLGLDLPLAESQSAPSAPAAIQPPPAAAASARVADPAPSAAPPRVEPAAARLAPPPKPADATSQAALSPAAGAAALKPPQRGPLPSSPGPAAAARPAISVQPPQAGQAAIAAAKGLTSNETPPVPTAGEAASGNASNAAARAAQQREASATAGARRSSKSEDLSEPRLREIYSQYVNSRRERNESTAGITFEKLADSLRSQADKLRTKHASKRVDYEIVVKDGKTLIKPIVR